MAKQQTASYFESRPDIVKIFNDLEKFHDFCRFELVEFNPAYLYKRDNPIWNQYYQSTKPRREWKQKGDYNRGGNRNNQSRNFTR